MMPRISSPDSNPSKKVRARKLLPHEIFRVDNIQNRPLLMNSSSRLCCCPRQQNRKIESREDAEDAEDASVQERKERREASETTKRDRKHPKKTTWKGRFEIMIRSEQNPHLFGSLLHVGDIFGGAQSQVQQSVSALRYIAVQSSGPACFVFKSHVYLTSVFTSLVRMAILITVWKRISYNSTDVESFF